jgi:putative transcriptional regulator
MNTSTNVSNSIRALRFANGEMTQSELGAKIGVTRQTIMAIEQGRYSPSLEMAFQIAKAFGLPLDDVFRFEDPEG